MFLQPCGTSCTAGGWIDENGDTVHWPGSEHAAVICGYDGDSAICRDPNAGAIGIIAFAHREITRKNSPIKNVVLDLSCNGGGVYVAYEMIPEGPLARPGGIFIPLKFSGREPYRSKPSIGFATRSSQEARTKRPG